MAVFLALISGYSVPIQPLPTLNNSGSITSGGSGFGIAILDSTLTTLNNSGSITGGLYGMYLSNLGAATTINHNAGTISGGVVGIDAFTANQDVTLNWNGGTISGQVNGLKTLNINLDHASLNGGLLMPAGSTIRMRLTDNNSQPVLALGGFSYNLGSGSKILLRPSASNFAVNNQTYTLISSEGGSAPGLSVLSESPYLTVNSFSVGGINLTATVSIAAAPQINGSPNAQRAGSAITPLLSAMAIANPDDPVLTALSGSQAVQTSEQLVPEVNGAAVHAANTPELSGRP